MIDQSRAEAPAKQRKPNARSFPSFFKLGEEIPRTAYLLVAIASFLIPFLAWCFLSYTGKVNPLILPTPTRMVTAAIDMFRGGNLLPDVQISIYRIGMGFLFSALLAIPIGILMGAYQVFEAAHEPFVSFVRYIPVPALIPLVMVIAGIDEPAKILLIFIGTYFQMVILVAEITRQVPKDLLNAGRTLGASRMKLVFNVLLPATLPGIIDVCRAMLGWAWTYLVIAEVVATSSGIGFSIMRAQRFSRSDEIFVGIILLGLLGLGTDMLFKMLQHKFFHWAEVQKN